MAETNYKDYKFRQLILNEWHAKSDSNEATENICAKLGEGAITSTKVKYWYKRFNKGDTAMFTKDSKLYVSTQVDTQDASNSLLLFTNKRVFNKEEMVTSDGRLAIFVRTNSAVFYDLFHDSQKIVPFPVPIPFRGKILIVGEHLVSFSGWRGREIYTLKINYGDLTVSALNSVSVRAAGDQFYCSYILLDQSNENRFLVVVSNNDWYNRHDVSEKSAIGQVIDGQVVLGQFNDLVRNSMEYKRLSGNKLQGFVYAWLAGTRLKFCEIDLSTMQATSHDAPILLDNESLLSVPRQCQFDYHSWAGDSFYGLWKDYDKEFHLLAFNAETSFWSNVRISANSPKYLFASPDGMITLQVSTGQSNIIYRFATKKPDSLQNLAWFAILRSSVIFGSEIFARIAHRLPYTCDLRSLISGNDQDEKN